MNYFRFISSYHWVCLGSISSLALDVLSRLYENMVECVGMGCVYFENFLLAFKIITWLFKHLLGCICLVLKRFYSFNCVEAQRVSLCMIHARKCEFDLALYYDIQSMFFLGFLLLTQPNDASVSLVFLARDVFLTSQVFLCVGFAKVVLFLSKIIKVSIFFIYCVSQLVRNVCGHFLRVAGNMLLRLVYPHLWAKNGQILCILMFSEYIYFFYFVVLFFADFGTYILFMCFDYVFLKKVHLVSYFSFTYYHLCTSFKLQYALCSYHVLWYVIISYLYYIGYVITCL